MAAFARDVVEIILLPTVMVILEWQNLTECLLMDTADETITLEIIAMNNVYVSVSIPTKIENLLVTIFAPPRMDPFLDPMSAFMITRARTNALNLTIGYKPLLMWM